LVVESTNFTIKSVHAFIFAFIANKSVIIGSSQFGQKCQ